MIDYWHYEPTDPKETPFVATEVTEDAFHAWRESLTEVVTAYHEYKLSPSDSTMKLYSDADACERGLRQEYDESWRVK